MASFPAPSPEMGPLESPPVECHLTVCEHGEAAELGAFTIRLTDPGVSADGAMGPSDPCTTSADGDAGGPPTDIYALGYGDGSEDGLILEAADGKRLRVSSACVCKVSTITTECPTAAAAATASTVALHLATEHGGQPGPTLCLTHLTPAAAGVLHERFPFAESAAETVVEGGSSAAQDGFDRSVPGADEHRAGNGAGALQAMDDGHGRDEAGCVHDHTAGAEARASGGADAEARASGGADAEARACGDVEASTQESAVGSKKRAWRDDTSSSPSSSSSSSFSTSSSSERRQRRRGVAGSGFYSTSYLPGSEAEPSGADPTAPPPVGKKLQNSKLSWCVKLCQPLNPSPPLPPLP